MANKLSSYGQLNQTQNRVKMDEILDTEVTVNGFTLVQGKNGSYAVMDVTKADGEKVTVSCGGSFIIEALIQAKANKAFPVSATFTKKGNAYWAE